MRTLFLFLLLVFASHYVFAQHYKSHPNIPIDTGYTLHSAYTKYKKYYPDIAIAKWTPTHEITVHRDLVYKKIKKRYLHLDVFSPRTDTLLPCIVLVHGGGWITGDKSMWETWALALADAGYASVLVEYRFAHEAQYPAAVKDITSAVQWLGKHGQKYHINSSKIIMMGGSAGGQLAALVGTTFNTGIYKDKRKKHPKASIAAIVDLDGVLAFIHPVSKEGMGTPEKPSAATQWFGIHFSKDSSAWIEASPLTHTNAETPPTLFIASKHPRFLAGYADMQKILRANDIATKYIKMEDAPHSYWLFDPWFAPTYKFVVKFVVDVVKE